MISFKNLGFIVIVLITGLAISCNKKDSETDENHGNSGNNQIIADDEIEDEFDYMDVVTIETGNTVILDDIETFVQISILFNHYNMMWLDEISEMEDYSMDVSEYLAKKRNKFYSSLGISENEFNEYSIENYQELSEFLDDNEIYNKAYNASQDY